MHYVQFKQILHLKGFYIIAFSVLCTVQIISSFQRILYYYVWTLLQQLLLFTYILSLILTSIYKSNQQAFVYMLSLLVKDNMDVNSVLQTVGGAHIYDLATNEPSG